MTLTMTEPKRRWIQGGLEGGRGGYEIRARVRRWAEARTNTPIHLFDHTRIWRVDGHLVIETSPYTDLDRYQLEQAFSGFNRHGWSVRVEPSERGKTCSLVTLTSPKDWELPRALELGLKRKMYGPNSMVHYFLP